MKTEEFMKPKMTFGDTLRFTAYAWAKLIWMRDRGETEVAGYATTSTDDPLLVTDFRLVKQKCTPVSFDLDPDDLTKDVEHTLDMGLSPWQTHNILCHSHPGDSPSPSLTDEKNFVKAFSHPHWAIMFIVAEGGDSYCRMKINVGPGVVKTIKVAIDWKQSFNGTDISAWEEEYNEKVTEIKFLMTGKKDVASSILGYFPENDFSSVYDPLLDEELEFFWDANGNVACWDDSIALGGEWFYYDPIAKKWYTDVSCDDANNEIVETVPQNKHLVVQAVLWANKHIDERNLMLENAS